MPPESVEDGSGRQSGSGQPGPGVVDLDENLHSTVECYADRGLQDHIIRYLTDPQARSSQAVEFLDDREAERAQRFSRFLARRYYRDRLHRGFRYSARLLSPSDSLDELVNIAEFEAILDNCILGSFATAKDVGQLAIKRLSSSSHDRRWNELLHYEFAFFMQLATSEVTPRGLFAKKSVSTVMYRFRLRVPDLLKQLRSGEMAEREFDGEATLIFSRTTHGRVYVAEIDEATAAVLTAVDSNSSDGNIASSCSLPVEEIQRILATLSDIGAVVLPAAATLDPAV